MSNFLAVALGGATGSVLRYSIILLTLRIGSMPYYATLTVNLLGCLVMGVFTETVLARATLPDSVKLLATTGLLGGFTTFSSFAFDTGRMVTSGNFTPAVLYILASVIGGMLAFYGGLSLAKLA